MIVGVVEQMDGAGDGQEENQQLDGEAMAGVEQPTCRRSQAQQVRQGEHAQQREQRRRSVHLDAPGRVAISAA